MKPVFFYNYPVPKITLTNVKFRLPRELDFFLAYLWRINILISRFWCITVILMFPESKLYGGFMAL